MATKPLIYIINLEIMNKWMEMTYVNTNVEAIKVMVAGFHSNLYARFAL